jgi:hypothetical protein
MQLNDQRDYDQRDPRGRRMDLREHLPAKTYYGANGALSPTRSQEFKRTPMSGFPDSEKSLAT